MISKKFLSCLETINDLKNSQVFKLSGGADFLDSKEVILSKKENQFNIVVSFDERDKKYFNDVLDTKITPFKLISNSSREYIVSDKSTIFLSFNQLHKNDDSYYDYELKGVINKVMTAESIKVFDNKYQRLLIPFDASGSPFVDFQRWIFDNDVKSTQNFLIKVAIKGSNFQFYSFKFGSEFYWGVDSLETIEFSVFQEMAFSILNAYGFIKADLFLGEAYYFSCENVDYEKHEFLFESIRNSIETGYSIYTTNAYSVHAPYYKSMGIEINHDEIKLWLEKLQYFSEKDFSKLSECFFEHEALSRACLIILEANKLPLELKAASYCVAYEAICHTIKNVLNIESPSVIDKANWEANIKKDLNGFLKQLLVDGKINVGEEEILAKKINNLNQPTNRDSLTAPFTYFGYTLNTLEYKCIDNRNKFLHGSLPIKSKDEDESIKELYFISKMIHKLVYILVLKFIGFEGYIINYPELNSHITGKKLNEDVLIKI